MIVSLIFYIMNCTFLQKVSFTCWLIVSVTTLSAQPLYRSFEKSSDLHHFFRYRAGNPILVSAHRGGMEPGFPENSLESFINVLRQHPAIFEIDPRLTKDSIIVLMHDKTLDRTTNASGNLSDYTWAELQQVKLKDAQGNVTNFSIPLLEDVIRWGQGKTILNLDKKDVPLPLIVALIKRLKAEKHVMLTVHTGAQARYYHDRLPNIMFSAFCRNQKEFDDIAISGVPWNRMIAYVGPAIDETNIDIVNKLHALGVKCMISLAPTHDKLKDKASRAAAYREEIIRRPDIIETDRPAELWQELMKSDNSRTTK